MRLGNGTGSVFKKSGNRRKPWVARKTVGFKLNGQPIYRYIGYYRTKAEAMTALMDYNRTPYSLEGETLRDMYEGFYSQYSEQRDSGSVSNMRSNRKHLEPIIDTPIAKLTRRQLQFFFDDLSVSVITKRRVKTLIKQIMEYSIRYDVIPPERIEILNYIDITSSVPILKVEREVFSNEEIERLWQIDDDFSHLILFLIYTGLRAGEYCDLTEDSIDEDMVIHITNSKTEAGIRSVPLSDKALSLAPLPHFEKYQKLYYNYLPWAKLHGFSHNLHDTRHTCASLLANAGVDERIVKAILGHKENDVTAIYTHISIESMRNALNSI